MQPLDDDAELVLCLYTADIDTVALRAAVRLGNLQRKAGIIIIMHNTVIPTFQVVWFSFDSSVYWCGTDSKGFHKLN